MIRDADTLAAFTDTVARLVLIWDAKK